MRCLSLCAWRSPLAAPASCGRKRRHPTPRPASTTITCHHHHHQGPTVSSRRALSSTSRVAAANLRARGAGRQHSIILGRHVSEALANGCPVVALESTVITHGLPEPRNLELALQLEREIAQGLWLSPSSSSSSLRGQVVPATVGIVRGQLIVGLSRDQIEFLARTQLSEPIKASRRDIPLAQACRLSAGTTVSATMALATSCSANRIAVFATGGLGGVHLGGERSMDVSADLHEMARSPMGLVSSGFKSFLDTRRSLELLETLGCTVASLRGFEETYLAELGRHADADDDERDLSHASKMQHLFPGFFTTTCKERVKSPWQCDSVEEAARILYHCLGPAAGAHDSSTLANPRAMLLACPIPGKFSLDDDDDDDEDSDSQARYSRELLEKISAQIDGRQDLSGNEKTPLILAELNRLTGGKTLAANLELLKNNARIGAHLAYEYALLCNGNRTGPPSTLAETEDAHGTLGGQEGSGSSRSTPKRGAPIVIGCTMIDMHVRTKIDDKFKAMPHYSGVTFDGEPHLTLGGVGRNLATAIELLGHRPMFITSLARDNLGQFARAEMRQLLGTQKETQFKILEWQGQEPESRRVASSCFALVLIDSLTGQCEYVIANLEAKRAISRENLDVENLDAKLKQGHTPLVVLDANLPGPTLDYLFELCHERRVPVFLEPTDVACLPSLVATIEGIKQANSECSRLNSLAFLSPNVIELCELVALFRQLSVTRDDSNTSAIGKSELTVHEIEALARELMGVHLPNLAFLLVTMDKRGLLVVSREGLQDTRALLSKLNGDLSGGIVEVKYYQPLEVIESPVSGSGAGDCFAAGFISGLLSDANLDECVAKGFQASLCALRDESTVPYSLREICPNVMSK